MGELKVNFPDKTPKFSFYQILTDATRQFCKNTSIHGCRYIAQVDKSVYTRFAWTFILAIVYTLASVLMYNAWLYNNNVQIMTVSDTIFYPVWNYQFPAVTICNINKISLKKVQIFANRFKLPNMTLNEAMYLSRHLVQLQYMNYHPEDEEEYKAIQKMLAVHNVSVEEAMWLVRPDCGDLLNTCVWKSRIWRCDSLFEETRTALGICCSFNYYGFKNNTFSGYFSDRYKTEPRRISACGSSSGLRVLIRNKPEDYYVSEIPTYGVKVLLHDSHDFPGFGATNAIMTAGTNNFMSVEPTLTYATGEFGKLNASVRECVFDWERKLHMFNNYSWINCMTECRIVIVYKYCGCVPFFVRNINIRWKITEKACAFEELKCLSDYKDVFFNALPEFSIPFSLGEYRNVCFCLPECEVTDYSVETSSVTLTRKTSINERQLYSGMPVKNHSIVNIYFKDLVSTRNKRDVSISWYSEMALFGGLLGLCFGFSFTSGFEIIYTFTIKLFLDSVHHKNKICQKKKKIQRKKNFFQEFDKNVGQISFISHNKLVSENKYPKIN